MGKKKTAFPAQLLISLENEGDCEDEYFSVNRDPEGAAERGVKKRVAYYRLVEEGTVETGVTYKSNSRQRR